MAKATFIMPSIRDNHIEKAIGSCLCQTEKDIELIIFNNDENRIMEHDDERVTILNGANIKLWDCYNIGIEMSTSPFIFTMGDDDINYPERVEISLYYLNKGYDLIYSSYIGIDAWGKFYCYFPAPRFDYDKHIRKGSIIAFPTVAFRKSVAPKFRPEFYVIGDWVFVTEFWKNSQRFRPINVPLCYYRVWSGSITQNSRERTEIEENRMARELFKNEKIRTDRKIVKLEESTARKWMAKKS